MHSRFFYILRKKLLLIALVIIIAVIWGFTYSSTYNDNSFISNRMRNNDKDGIKGLKLIEKISVKEKEAHKPTVINLQTLYELNKREKYFKDWNKILLDKEEKERMENFAIISRDEAARRKIADEMKMTADRQAKYEGQLKKMGIPVIVGLGPTNKHKPPEEVLVHFDLKGGPLKIKYIMKILPMLKTLGASGLLLEYEDMFPYSGILSSITAKNAYSKRNIIEILQTAHLLGLKVIPLVQTFGHLEFALKLKEFQHLREVYDSPQSICPSLNSSFTFIEELLTQVINLHTLNRKQQRILMNRKGEEKDGAKTNIPQITHIHIGCDEVYQLGSCNRCRERVRDTLFLDHVYNVAGFVKKKWPKINVIIWDDQLRSMSADTLRASGIGRLVEPMIWAYTEDIYKFISSMIWDKYSQVFKTSWVAGAFKGAFGETLLIPQARRHLENALRWLAIIQGEGTRFQEGIKGIALTGWSRYDHFATLCELFPSSIPSLAVCLHTVSKGYFEVDSKANSIIPSLTCPEAPSDRYLWLDLQKDPNLNAFSRCLFPGSSLFRYINRLSIISNEAREFIDSIKYSRGWLSEYNIRHNYTSSSRVMELLEDQPRILASLLSLGRSIGEGMTEMYDYYTIGEYIEQHIYPLVTELRNLEKIGESLKVRKVYFKRPLPYLEQFIEELGITQKISD